MGRTALITGASSGIGQATARAFAGAGIHLILCGRRKERLEALKAELEGKVNVQLLTFDVSDYDAVGQAIQSILDPIDILVNNAGNAHGLSSIQDGDIRDWNAMIQSNVIGLLNVSKFVMPGMVERKDGHIVNLSSVAGKHVYENGAVYCATKHSVEAISEGMRKDLTPHNIRVTNIAPGAVETEFSLVRFKGDADRASKVYEGFEPLKPEDIADAILYCVNAPAHVTVADMTLYARAQSAPTTIYKK